MALRPPAPIPATSALPLCVDDDLVLGLVRSLPRPHPANPAEYGRKMIHRALTLVRACAPADPLQAAVAVRMALEQVWVEYWSQVAAASAEKLGLVMRVQRHGQSLSRGVAAGERRLDRQRVRMEALGASPEAELQDYDLAALEAVWLAGPVVGALEAEGVKAAKPPAPRVPLWKQNGRQYIHQIKDNELAELMEAKEKGEELEWPPYHPRDPVVLGWRPDPEPKKPYKYWGDMTMEERRERYGYKTTEQMAAEKAAQDAAAGDAGVGG